MKGPGKSDRSRRRRPSQRIDARDQTQPRNGGPSFPVVGIGASAGGLEAFSSIFSALPGDTGMGFVVLSHLDPTHPSILPSILARSTHMPVIEVREDHPIEPNRVYVLPPGQDMTIDGNTLRPRPRAAQPPHHPVDLFLRSLARERGPQAIGVVLSGTADDGTLGLRAIKEENGITFAQDDSARQTSMPHSAIADGSVDFVLPPHQIAAELARLSRAPSTPQDAVPLAEDDAARIAEIMQIVRRETGVDFTHYKGTTLRRRILRRAVLMRENNLDDYIALLKETPEEARSLHDDLLIGVTSFFRDPEAFEALSRKAFPRLMNGDGGNDSIRVWVLGCSTGEEAYSLAMALTEFIEQSGADIRLQIFASDLNAAGIEIARNGTYPADIVQDVPPERLKRFFAHVDGRYRVVKRIRDLCVFSHHNVLTDPPFSRIDLVSCRNLLMYLEPVLQQEVIRNLHYALKPGGVLWLGTADTTGEHHDLFEAIDPEHKIFSPLAGTASHPTLRTMSSRLRREDPPSVNRALLDAADLQKQSDRFLLSRFAPPAVLVSPSMEILQYRGDVGPYIAPTSGKASLSLVHVLDRKLQVAVRATINKAERQGGPVRTEGVHITSPNGDERRITVEVVPIGSKPVGFLVMFEEPRERPEKGQQRTRAVTAPRGAEAAQLARLTRELADTQEYLQTVIAEQEAAHDELEVAHEQAQSANEELQSINEELQTSKEEIQSANEELTTLNDELTHRNTELQLTNSDLLNLMASTNFAVLFVGSDMSIRRFTSAAATLLGLRPADVGRPLRDLRLSLNADVEARVTETMTTLAATEQNVQDDKGRWMSLRVRPYRTLDNHIDGAVVMFVDIDAVVRARRYAESIIATVRTPLVVLNERLELVTANDSFYRAFQLNSRQAEGRSLFDLGTRQWDVPELQQLLQRVLPADQVITDFSIQIAVPGHSPRSWMLNARRLVQGDGEQPLLLMSMEDVSEREHAEGLRQQRVDELAAADQSKNEFLALLAHELRNPLAPIQTAVQILSAPGVPATASEHAHVVINRQIRNMARLIDDLLDVARITQGKLDLQLAPLELTALLRRAIELVDRALRERGQEISVSLPSEHIYVLGDSTRLEQAFGNLLNNSSKYTKQGGHIWIGAETRPMPSGPDVLVYVRDEGIGIAPHHLPYVFDLFQQGDVSPHRASGLGVGLALVRRIVELHGGRVSVHSDGRDRGSEFVVCLPLLEHAELAAPKETAPAEVTGEPQRVLVADDNVDAAESFAALLRLSGHDVRTAHDGPAALELAPQFLPTLIFLDIAMPAMDGYEVARRLRRMPSLKSVVLVAVTGFGRDEDRQRARDAGFDRYVTKPLPPTMLPGLLVRTPNTRS